MGLLFDLPLRILLVEDDPVSAAIARDALSRLGICADHATTGEEALRLHQAQPYRIVLSDWVLPGFDGAELCRQLRNASSGYVYFILLSAADGPRRLEAFEAGVDDFLDKPLQPEELRARLTVARRILAFEDRVAGELQDRAESSQQMAELNESLKLASRRFEDLFDGLPVACFTFDRDGLVHDWNRAAEDAFGIPAFDTLTRPVWEVFPAGPWSDDENVRIFSGLRHLEFDWSYDGPDGPREFACHTIVMVGRGGVASGAVCAHVDITTRKRAERLLAEEKASLQDANARLHELASKDGLTGLWNRRSFMGDLDLALSEYRRTEKPFSLVLLDIDRFKEYNDVYGHPAGDEVLRRFARVLRSTARAYENPARYGGEEFAIILHNTGVAKGLAAAERFRKAVEGADWIERAVTCSLGVATVGLDGETADRLIAAADAALYTSKANGRNRCTHSTALSAPVGS